MKILKLIMPILVLFCSILLADSNGLKFGKIPHELQDKKLQPYTVMGKTYRPFIPPIGYTQTGKASWYGKDDGFDNKQSSSGESYDRSLMTAAHKTLPMNTIVKVTDINTKQSVIVRINDRGPFKKDRIIDLSEAAAKQLNIVHLGVANVIIKVLDYDPYIKSKLGKKSAIPAQNITEKLFVIQIAKLTNSDSVKYVLMANKSRYPNKKIIAVKIDNYYKIFISPFKSMDSARKYRDLYSIKGFPTSFAVNSQVGKQLKEKMGSAKKANSTEVPAPTKQLQTKEVQPTK